MSTLFKKLLNSLSLRDKAQFWFWMLVKFFLSSLDILGLLSIGLIFQKLQSPSASLGITNEVLGNFVRSIGIFQLTVITVGFFLLKIGLSVLVNFRSGIYVKGVELRNSTEAFEGVMSSPLEKSEQIGEKAIIHGLLGASHNAFGATILSFFIIVGEISLIAAISIYLAFVNAVLFFSLATIFVLLSTLANNFIGRRISEEAKTGDKLLIEISTFVSDALKNKRQIIGHGTLENFVKEFYPKRDLLATTNSRLIVFTTLPRYALELIMLLGLALLTAPYSFLSREVLDPATLAIFAMGLFRIIGSMLPLQNQINLLRRIHEEATIAFALQPFYIDALPPASNESSGERAQDSFHGMVLADVNYKYPGESKYALRNINLEIHKGEFLALVGNSGSGKSTFADIVIGLREPTSGSRTIPTAKQSESRIVFGYVPQSVTLFNGTLRENVAMCFDDSQIDEKRLKDAILGSSLDNLVMGFENREHEQLNDQNRGLSGGEVQRIGIARALYAGAEVIVLDESTSALDKDSESAIVQTIKNLKGKKTLLVIAHRKETILAADRVLKFAAGEAVFITREQIS